MIFVQALGGIFPSHGANKSWVLERPSFAETMFTLHFRPAPSNSALDLAGWFRLAFLWVHCRYIVLPTGLRTLKPEDQTTGPSASVPYL